MTLRIHTHVREDVIALYGFATPLEQELFERLIGISGIGPKLALAVLSGIEPAELIRAIRVQDVARLTAIPGVGKKTAERIGLELKDRLPARCSRPSMRRLRRAPRISCATICCRRCSTWATSVRPAEKAIETDGATPDVGFETGAARRAACADEGTMSMRWASEAARHHDRRPARDRRSGRRGRAVRSGPAAANARRVHRPGARPREPARLDHRGEAARRSARSRAALRPAGPRQDDARLRHRQRARRRDPSDRRTGDRESRRPRRDADRTCRSARCSSSTKSTA